MQSVNPQLTEQDQQRFNRQLQDPNDEIGLRSDEEEDEEDDSGDDEFVSILRRKPFHSGFFLLVRMNRKRMVEWIQGEFVETNSVCSVAMDMNISSSNFC